MLGLIFILQSRLRADPYILFIVGSVFMPGPVKPEDKTGKGNPKKAGPRFCRAPCEFENGGFYIMERSGN